MALVCMAYQNDESKGLKVGVLYDYWIEEDMRQKTIYVVQPRESISKRVKRIQIRLTQADFYQTFYPFEWEIQFTYNQIKFYRFLKFEKKIEKRHHVYFSFMGIDACLNRDHYYPYCFDSEEVAALNQHVCRYLKAIQRIENYEDFIAPHANLIITTLKEIGDISRAGDQALTLEAIRAADPLFMELYKTIQKLYEEVLGFEKPQQVLLEEAEQRLEQATQIQLERFKEDVFLATEVLKDVQRY